MIEFKDLSFCVEKKSPWWKKKHNVTKPILEGITGSIQAGELVALMGASGAGKTTLLDILACRKTQGVRGGTLLHSGQEKRKLTNQEASYVLQTDNALANLTVEETLIYAARLRLPNLTLSDAQKIAYDLMTELQIEHCAHTRVGSAFVRGISGGELRRLSIAQELVNNPRYLFLDEPTSGLDSSSSFGVVTLLKQLSKNRNQVIVCSIHQPSSQVFATFDRVLLLVKCSSVKYPGAFVGRVAYFGPTKDVKRYCMKQLGKPCPKAMNIADHIIEITKKPATSDEVKREGSEGSIDLSKTGDAGMLSTIPERWTDFSKENPQIDGSDSDSEAEVKSPKNGDLDVRNVDAPMADEMAGDFDRYPTSYWNQYRILTHRTFLDTYRAPNFFFTRVMKIHILGIIISSIYWRLGYSAIAIQNRVSALFFILLVSYMLGTSLLPIFIIDRPITISEKSSRLYGDFVHMASSLTVIFPFEILNAVIFTTYTYWLTNLHPWGFAYFRFLVLFVLMVIWMDMYSLAVGAVAPTPELATAISPLIFCLFMIFGGYFVLIEGLPVWWKWAIWASPFYYALTAALYNEFHDVPFPCNATNGTSANGTVICTFTSGNQLLQFYGIMLNDGTFWAYITAVAGAGLVSGVFLYLSLRCCRWEIR